MIPGQQPKQDSGQLLRKNAIERRFLSKSPQPHWSPDKTIAGRQLIARRSECAEQLRSRLRSAARAKSVSQSGGPSLAAAATPVVVAAAATPTPLP
jgi:hypothetical protein